MTVQQPDIRKIQVIRYVSPLREGGSLPAIVEGDDGFLYVLKFRGAGQGTKALIAELIGAELARLAGFYTPEIVFAELDAAFGRNEPDEEIQDLLKASTGLNLGLHFLSGAITYDPAINKTDALLASKVVWLDAFLMNVDRTAKNTNMLTWHKELWLIDYGASLYFHHSWQNWQEYVLKPFTQIKDHVLLPLADNMDEADKEIKALITPENLKAIVSLIPDTWLEQGDESADSLRAVYQDFLIQRLTHSEIFVNEAKHARKARF
jgi:hypothetical protein